MAEKKESKVKGQKIVLMVRMRSSNYVSYSERIYSNRKSKNLITQKFRL